MRYLSSLGQAFFVSGLTFMVLGFGVLLFMPRAPIDPFVMWCGVFEVFVGTLMTSGMLTMILQGMDMERDLKARGSDDGASFVPRKDIQTSGPGTWVKGQWIRFRGK